MHSQVGPLSLLIGRRLAAAQRQRRGSGSGSDSDNKPVEQRPRATRFDAAYPSRMKCAGRQEWRVPAVCNRRAGGTFCLRSDARTERVPERYELGLRQ